MKMYNTLVRMLLALLTLTMLALSAPITTTSVSPSLPAVNSQALQDAITLPHLMARAHRLQELYDVSSRHSEGTLGYILDTLGQYSDYYDINVLNFTLDDHSGKNICAQTKGGNQSNVLLLGAHYDTVTTQHDANYQPVASVPGIDDNGSGVVALLEAAVQLTNYTTSNSIRFCFWDLEELVLLGSWAYLKSLPAEKLSEIRLYLNFDMLAAPNYRLGVLGGKAHLVSNPYDGDNEEDQTVPLAPGSAQAAAFFGNWFESQGLNHTHSSMAGHDGVIDLLDSSPFSYYGIPISGLETGDGSDKTAQELEMFGGTREPTDACYHQACDNVTNLNKFAFVTNAKAVAAAVAHFGTSLDEIPQRDGTMPKPVDLDS